jgi:hypothetical protein
MPVGGIIAGVGSAVGGIAGAIGSKSASNQAAAASNQAAQLSHQQYLQTRQDLMPYNQAGQSVLPSLTRLAQAGQTGGGPDYLSQAAMLGSGPQQQQYLEATPGYQFQLQQGLKATQSAAAARGLGVSGAALKGAATFATGLANSNYQQQFQNLLALNTGQQGNITGQYNRLSGIAGMGESAGAQTGTIGANLANTSAAATQAAGTAQGAGALGIGNALSGGINNYLQYSALQNALNPATRGYNVDEATAGSLNAHSAISGGY